MSSKERKFQPGKILHEVIVGAFRARGSSFSQWCADNGMQVNTANLATYGQSSGPRGRELLERIISDAGPEVVEAAYRERMTREAAKLTAAAAERAVA